MSFLVVVELLCFLQQAYKEKGDGCLSGLPIPAEFCLEYILCSFLKLPTTEEKDEFYNRRNKHRKIYQQRQNNYYKYKN